jgi:hypothetical protein
MIEAGQSEEVTSLPSCETGFNSPAPLQPWRQAQLECEHRQQTQNKLAHYCRECGWILRYVTKYSLPF